MSPYLPDFEDLLRAIELTGGFVLLPIEVRGPDVARALGDWLGARGHPAVVKEPRDDAEWRDIAGWLLQVERPDNGVIMVLGSRDPPPGVNFSLRLVNERRDAIAKHLDCPLLWCGPQGFLLLTAARAPDFWSVRAVERRLELAKEQAAPKMPMQDYVLEEARRQGDVRSVGTLLVARARDALSAGKLEEAEALVAGAPEGLKEKDPRIYIEMGLLQAEIARRQHRIAHALDRLDDIGRLTMIPREPRVELLRGRVWERAGDMDRAREAYRHVVLEASSLAAVTLAKLRYLALKVRMDHESDAALQDMREEWLQTKRLADGPLEALATALLAQATARTDDRVRARHLLEEAVKLAERAEGDSTVLFGGEVTEELETARQVIMGQQAGTVPVTPTSVEMIMHTERKRESISAGRNRKRLFLMSFVLMNTLVTFTILLYLIGPNSRVWAPARHIDLGLNFGDAGSAASPLPSINPTPSDAGPSPSPRAVDGGLPPPRSVDGGLEYPMPYPYPAYCSMAKDGEMRCAPGRSACEALRARSMTISASPCHEVWILDDKWFGRAAAIIELPNREGFDGGAGP